MKRFLVWLVGVAAGVCLFLAAAMGVSYYFTTEARLPEQTAAFAGTELAVNGWCWHVPMPFTGRLLHRRRSGWWHLNSRP